jgi:hypothetical protein
MREGSHPTKPLPLVPKIYTKHPTDIRTARRYMNIPWKRARNVSSPGQHDDMASQQVAVVLLLRSLVLATSQLLHNLTAGVTVRRASLSLTFQPL